MPTQNFTRAPGFYDRTPEQSLAISALTADLQRLIARFGYQPIETPMIEYADLFLTKSGDESVNRLFTFEMYGRQLCLRSEFTPSAARLYVERYQHAPKPIRWQFAGPVFRYETQRNQSRQFNMLGTELIGPSGPAGDAETIGLAAYALRSLGLTGWTLNIGHVGLMALLIERFDLDRRMRRFLIGQIENLRRPNRGRAYVEERVAELFEGLPPSLDAVAEYAAAEDEEGLSGALRLLLQSADLGTTGSGRTSEDIARRLLNKQRRANRRDEVTRALDFLQQLISLEGAPDHVLPELEKLLPDTPELKQILADFKTTLGLLAAYDIDPAQTRLQMGLARGLNYYTGLVFDIVTGKHSEQLCGGGRYDDFIGILGAAQETPAIGFAFWLERIQQALQDQDKAADATGMNVQAVVVPVDQDDDAEAARVAMLLRARVDTELHAPPTRKLSSILARAGKRGVPYVIIVGAAERARGEVMVRDMKAETQFACPIADLPAKLFPKP